MAAEHLKAAGADDLARDLMQKSEAMEREFAEAKRKLAAEMQARVREGSGGGDGPRELKAEIERLRAEVAELRQAVEEKKKKDK